VDIDIDGATDALFAEGDAGSDTPIDDTPAVEQVVEESFTGIDPSALGEDMQAVYKSMQADYTRKTQEIADMRKSFEQFSEHGIDPAYALEAVGFIQRLDNDPAFAAEVARHLAPQSEHPTTAQQPMVDTNPNNGESYDNLPAALQEELNQMRAFRQEMVEAQEQAQMINELEYEESQIRAQYPHYSDTDIEHIYSLAYATEGDLLAAQQLYHSMEQGMLNRYLQSKNVPMGATSPNGMPASAPASSFGSVDDAHKAAMELVRNLQ